MDFDNTMDFDIELDLVDGDYARAADRLAAAHRRVRAGTWTPSWDERVTAANLLAAARPGPAGRPIADGWRLAWLARWAPLIRLARSTDLGPDPGAGLAAVLGAVYPPVEFLERHAHRHTRRRYLQPALRRALDDIDTILETGPVSLTRLLDTIAPPWPPGTPEPARTTTRPASSSRRERQVMASLN